ncbi:MAG: sigma 54-interacting transcriptional regulator [Planctomycetes bacterium]|nr:sigma 54-interacting transcriptional regulator [Planctomycetota bacterium]
MEASTRKIAAVIFDSITEGVFTTDHDCRITSFNRAAEQMTGFTREQAVGRYCFDIFRTEICQTRCALRHTLANGKPISDVRVTIMARDGRPLPISVNTTILRDKRGEVVGAVEFFRDLSVEEALRERLSRMDAFANLRSNNDRMQRMLDLLPEVAAAECNVLIHGSSGTGKELIAQAIHNLSPRQHGPYVRVNCAALPQTLLESELFGYVKGAFTDAKRDKPGQFQVASGGTLLLDEIADMPPSLQVKLLRVLNNGEFQPLGSTKTLHTDARILTSTNRNIEAMVEEGTFREDLYYRINVVNLEVSPLRERLEDLPRLVNHFIERFRGKRRKPIARVSDDVMALLRRYDWPGNIRELENAVEHAFVLCRGDVIEVEHLPERLATKARERGSSVTRFGDSSAEAVIRECLARNDGDRSKAARELGMHRSTLWRKMRQYGILTP